jgi:hypothetical protein
MAVAKSPTGSGTAFIWYVQYRCREAFRKMMKNNLSPGTVGAQTNGSYHS